MKFSSSVFVAASMLVLAGAAHAGCDFFEHNDHKGKKLALKDGECAVLSRDHADGCEGLKVRVVEGWNDTISSVVLNHNSTAILKEHDKGEGRKLVIQGNRGTKSVGDFNDLASVALCRQ